MQKEQEIRARTKEAEDQKTDLIKSKINKVISDQAVQFKILEMGEMPSETL